MNIAMWSGPRNLSTAMMYAFAARGDCAVWDEPFYAAYLRATGLTHPMRDAILAAHDGDAARVAAACAAPAPDGSPHFYQKHMAQHMVPGMPLGWADHAANVFLIRHPARVVASYAKKREGPTEDDLGFRRQAELFDRFADRQGRAPVVIDGTDIRADPAGMLDRLCTALGLPFTDRMLHWPAGPKPVRRRLGGALVRRRPPLHRVRRCRGAAARSAARLCRSGRGLPAALRETARVCDHVTSRLRDR
jgi:hypothetical protein